METEKKLSKSRLWQLANPEKHRAWTKAWHAKNPGKQNAYSRKYHAEHREKVNLGARKAYWSTDRARALQRERQLKRLGATTDQYNALHLAQGGVCAICLRPETSFSRQANKVRNLSLDHCHSNGHVRGLLCRQCNTGLGNFGDDVERLRAAIAYLSPERIVPCDIQYSKAEQLRAEQNNAARRLGE